MTIPPFNLQAPRANVLRDFPIHDTPFRGLVMRGPFSLCAYIGVPEPHWLADMEELEFSCHFGVTFRGAGDEHRPAGWYWYGWDYAHFCDKMLPFPGSDAPLIEQVNSLFPLPDLPPGKAWSVEEVVADIIDVAVALKAVLAAAESGEALAPKPDTAPPRSA